MRGPKPYSREQARRAVARTLRALRRRADGMSQEQLALQSGVDRSYVGEIERGLRSPTIEILLRLALTLGVTCAEFGAEVDTHLRRK